MKITGIITILLTMSLPAIASPPTATIKVEGLTCPFCSYGIEKKIRENPDVTGLTIRMRTDEVEVRYADGVTPDLDVPRLHVPTNLVMNDAPRKSIENADDKVVGSGGDEPAFIASKIGMTASTLFLRPFRFLVRNANSTDSSIITFTD